MAELIYFTGPMDCGESTLALQLDYTHTAGARKGRLFTSQDRAGAAAWAFRLEPLPFAPPEEVDDAL